MAINRTELVSLVAEKADLTKVQADKAIAALQETIITALGEGTTVRIPGLLSIERAERAARKGRNPRTGEELHIPAGYRVKIKPGLTLRNAVANS